MERPASGWNGEIRMERWESAMGRWHYYWPQAAGRARPGFARAPPSDASVLLGPAARWNDGGPDGTLKVRMERWLSRWDDGIIIGPRQARRPVRLPIRPSGPGQWRGAADAQLRAASGASKPNFDA